MERKIGEIFEYDGEWYQCIEAYDKCSHCDFEVNYYTCRAKVPWCSGPFRKDRKNVIFRKLKKVGKPYNSGKKVFQQYVAFIKPYIFNDEFPVEDLYIGIEIKQNKEEDMKTVRINKDDLNFLVNKIRYGILPRHTDCDAIIAEITDLFSVEDVNLSNTEKIGENLREFDLEAAKSGKAVCTRDGRKARIICFDVKSEMPIVALVESCNNVEVPIAYYNDGCIYSDEYNDDDLMMLPEKKEGWVNLYRDKESKRVYSGEFIFSEREKAEKHYECNDTKVAIVPVNWEE